MNISSEIFTIDGSKSSDHLFSNDTVEEISFQVIDLITITWCFPFNSYVIWLIVRGTGNGVEAEFFSLNLAVCEIFICMESFLIFLSYKFNILWMAVYFLDGLPITGRPLFQCLICVERYLAVVHPVIFLKYKPFRYRVICSVIAWVVAFVSCVVNIMMFLLTLTELMFVSFCTQFFLFLSFQLLSCLAVIRVLKQSGPGERGRGKVDENNLKRRAFYLILIANVSMVILYAPFIVLFVIGVTSKQTQSILMSVSYACFTSAGLVQPFLFLYRVRKLPFIK